MTNCSNLGNTTIERYDCEVEKNITNMVGEDRKRQNAACNKRIQEALRRSEEEKDSKGNGSENGLLSRMWNCVSSPFECPTSDPAAFFVSLVLLVAGGYLVTHLVIQGVVNSVGIAPTKVATNVALKLLADSDDEYAAPHLGFLRGVFPDGGHGARIGGRGGEPSLGFRIYQNRQNFPGKK